MNAWALPLVATVASPLAFASPAADIDWDTLQRGVARIQAQLPDGAGETGAGIVAGLDEDAIDILTAAHVVVGLGEGPARPATRIEVRFFDDQGTAYDAQLLGYYEDLDLAALRVRGAALRSRLDALPLWCTEPLAATGETLSLIGHARHDWERLIGVNVLLAPQADDDSRRMLLSNPGVDRGLSGGPIFGPEGCLVGLLRDVGTKDATGVKVTEVISLATGWGAHTDRLAGRYKPDLERKKKTFAGVAEALHTYSFNAEGVWATFTGTKLDGAQLAATISAYNRSYEPLYNGRSQYLQDIEGYWNAERGQRFLRLVQIIEAFHTRIVFSSLNDVVNVLRAKGRLSGQDRKKLDEILQELAVEVPKVKQAVEDFLEDLRSS
ncbi:MAG: serine protease [Vicinamibacteria bacterium]